ncbi:MAG: class I SAM-dependent methyltransferase [Nevskiales bacterium]
MSFYEKHVLPYLIDLACGIRPVRRQRQKLVPLASGKVLEVGIGTGLNLPHYDAALVERIWGLDPALEMHSLAAKRVARSGLPVQLVGLSAEKIPMADHSFDTVLLTYTLCSIADPVTALREMRRVLKPGGQLLFCEHGQAPDASVRRWQDRLTPVWSRIAGNCHLNRAVPQLLEASGFRTERMETLYLPGPRPLTYNYWGIARPI